MGSTWRKKGSRAVNLENTRYYTSVTLLVFACALLPATLIALGITKLFDINEKFRHIVFFATYTIIVFWGLRFYTPRMRGVI
jgi:hypothetical protein